MKLKSLEDMSKDVKEGDLVRIFLRGSDYVGYRWNLDKAHIDTQLMFPEDSDILFCGLNPYGITRMERDPIFVSDGKSTLSKQCPIVTQTIQFVGVNLKTRMLGNEKIRGYKILGRTTYVED